jgi:DNA-binding transcriptional regulator YdaS (Cro superfamily)
MTIKDPKVLKEKAVELAGNKARLAKLLGIARSSVSDWGEYVPTYQAYRLIQLFPELDSRNGEL